MANPFVKAVRTQAKLRLGLDGPSGSGKTYTALVAATALANGGKIAVIDTERNSASLYSDKFTFDVVCLDSFHPQKYIDMIEAAEEGGYAVIVIDSLSHAWEGEGGVLDLHDQAVKRQKSENSFTAWKDVTPVHRSLVDAILQSKCHMIVTMRSKMDYVQEKNDKGNTIIRKVGLAPIQRQGMEYEFTIVGDLDVDHNLVITKSRMESLADAVAKKPDVKWFKQIADWLGSAAPAPAPELKPAEQAPKAAPMDLDNKAKKSAPKPEPKPSASAQTPAPTDLADAIDAIGIQLWPVIWTGKKTKLIEAYTKDSKTNLAGVLEFLTKRDEEIKALPKYIEHVEKSWPGFGKLVEPAIAEAEKGGISPVNMYELLEGIQKAAASGKDNPADRVAMMLGALTEAQIPMEFR